jgi:hypothetical protein
MTNKQLSPAAQAVLDATDYSEDWATRVRVAAALRVLASECETWEDGTYMVKCNDIFDIANELEGKK